MVIGVVVGAGQAVFGFRQLRQRVPRQVGQVGAGHAAAVLRRGLYQKIQGAAGVGKAASVPQKPAAVQGGQQGPGGVVLVADLPPRVGPAEHAVRRAALHLHGAEDEIKKVFRNAPVRFAAGQRAVEQKRPGRLAAAVRADGIGGRLHPLRVDVVAQPLPDAAASFVDEKALQPGDPPVDRLPPAALKHPVVGKVGFGVVKDRRGREGRGRVPRDPFRDKRDQAAPGRPGRQPRPVEVVQRKGAHHHVVADGPKGGRVLLCHGGVPQAAVGRDVLPVHQQPLHAGHPVPGAAGQVGAVVQQVPRRKTGDQAVRLRRDDQAAAGGIGRFGGIQPGPAVQRLGKQALSPVDLRFQRGAQPRVRLCSPGAEDERVKTGQVRPHRVPRGHEGHFCAAAFQHRAEIGAAVGQQQAIHCFIILSSDHFVAGIS